MSEIALGEWVCSRYPLKGPVRCRFLRGSMSDVYHVDTPDAAYMLKIYLHNRHSRRCIEAEVELLNDLLENDIPVASPVANRERTFVNEINAPEGVRCAVLFDSIPGDPPDEENLAHSRAFGQLAGRLHDYADHSTKIYDRRHLDEKYLVEEPLAHIQPYLENRPNDWDYLSALGRELMGELRSLGSREKPEYGLCHGDLHAGNARFGRDGRLTLFDFDSYGYGWRAIDIGVYHVSYEWMDLSEETRRKKDRFWEAFIAGYQLVRPLSQNELAAAQLCLPIRHFELMGITIQYWSPQIGTGWINDEYFDRHLNWFKKWADTYRKIR